MQSLARYYTFFKRPLGTPRNRASFFYVKGLDVHSTFDPLPSAHPYRLCQHSQWRAMVMALEQATSTLHGRKESVDRKNGNDSSAHPAPPVPADQDVKAECGPFFFLTISGAEALKNFQYKGQDLSLIYKYVLSPLAEWCVQNLTPRSMAPNTITMTGLVFMIVAYSTMWFYRPMLLISDDEDMDGIPRWVFLLNAVSILVYQTLDNMDGKQARRVGASSPLGLFFDHGCDAVNSVFGSANWMVALCLSTSDVRLCFAMLMGPYALFYFGTWEEYYTGQLIMPIINGPNEGLLGAVCMSIISFLYGPAFWCTNSWWDCAIEPILPGFVASMVGPLRNADILILTSCIGFVQEVSLKTISVTQAYGWKAAINLLPFLTLVLCSVAVGLTDVSIWLEMPRTSLHLCSFLFVEMTAELMLKHMTTQPYQPLRWVVAPLVVFAALVTVGAWPDNYVSTSDFLLVYSTSTGAFLFTKTVILIHEITYTLNIWCFDITTPRIIPLQTMARVVNNKKSD